MTSAASNPPSDTSLARKGSRLRRWCMRVLFVLVTLVTLCVLYLQISKVRGRNAWHRMEAQLKEKGMPIYLADVLPPEIPDEENQVATPFWKGVFPKATMREVVHQYHMDDPRVTKAYQLVTRYQFDVVQGGTARAKWTEPPLLIRAWAKALQQVVENPSNQEDLSREQVEALPPAEAGRVVLDLLQVYDPVIDEFRAASDRPKARYPIDYSVPDPATIRLPHFVQIKEILRILRLRAMAHAVTGDVSRADEDVKLMFLLSESLKGEPTLISYLVRIAAHRITLETFRQVLNRGLAWPEPALARWQDRYRNLDLIAALSEALRAERTFGNSMFARMRDKSNRGHYAESLGAEPELELVVVALPTGWIYFEQVNYNWLFDRLLLFNQSPSGIRVDPAWVLKNEKDIQAETRDLGYAVFWRHRLFSSLLLPALVHTPEKAAQAQALVDMATLGSALERHRIETGTYPEALAALLPRYLDRLPDDVTAAQSYRFRRDADGAYTLWSIGYNQVDDQGTIAKESDEGDWAWAREDETKER